MPKPNLARLVSGSSRGGCSGWVAKFWRMAGDAAMPRLPSIRNVKWCIERRTSTGLAKSCVCLKSKALRKLSLVETATYLPCSLCPWHGAALWRIQSLAGGKWLQPSLAGSADRRFSRCRLWVVGCAGFCHGPLCFIVADSRSRNVRYLWLPVLGTVTVGVSLGLPLYLFLREIAQNK